MELRILGIMLLVAYVIAYSLTYWLRIRKDRDLETAGSVSLGTSCILYVLVMLGLAGMFHFYKLYHFVVSYFLHKEITNDDDISFIGYFFTLWLIAILHANTMIDRKKNKSNDYQP